MSYIRTSLTSTSIIFRCVAVSLNSYVKSLRGKFVYKSISLELMCNAHLQLEVTPALQGLNVHLGE